MMHEVSIMNSGGVYFDAYGTLLDLDDYYMEMSKDVIEFLFLPFEPEVFLNMWSAEFIKAINEINLGIRDFLNNTELHVCSLDETLKTISMELPISEIDEINDRREMLLKDKVRVLPDVRECLKRLLEQGVMLAVVSNADTEELSAHLRSCGLHSCFSEVVVSEEVRSYKPSEKIFRKAEGLMGKPALFIGDSLRCDVLGGRNAGWNTVWYNPGKTKIPEGAHEPEFEITSMLDVLDLLP